MGKMKKNLKKRVVHIRLPVKLWQKFDHWRVDQGYGTLTEGVKAAIRNVLS